jgi:tetratricopeptide (TPR) repeat protein
MEPVVFWQRKSVDQVAKKFGRTGDVETLERELRRMKPADLAAKERESWYFMWGIAAFRAGDYGEALRRFETGLAAVPTSGQIAFSLGQEYERTGDVDRAFALFDRFLFPAVSAAYALAAARYAYLWNEFTRGTAYVLPIFDAYFALGIADDHFLYVRGLPFYSQTWGYLAAFSEVRGDFGELAQITAKSKASLSDYEFSHLEDFLAAVEEGNFGRLFESIRSRNAEARRAGRPNGYLEMQAAALQALEIEATGDPAPLTSVVLGESDFRWLDDIRTACLAALAARRGDSAELEQHTNHFMARQPMLFEPDLAFTFRILAFQETIKARYRATRRTAAR